MHEPDLEETTRPHTATTEAPALGERIRAAVAERPFVTHDAYPGVSMTVSVGVAGETGGPIEPDALLARADAARYRAKEAGRNCVVAELPHAATPVA